MDIDQLRTSQLARLEDELRERGFLFERPDTYVAGVEDTLEAVAELLELVEP